jgi:hypothetical protein
MYFFKTKEEKCDFDRQFRNGSYFVFFSWNDVYKKRYKSKAKALVFITVENYIGTLNIVHTRALQSWVTTFWYIL